jgi:hypothetical protein
MRVAGIDEVFTFEQIPLGSHIAYRGSRGLMVEGLVIRKLEQFKRFSNPEIYQSILVAVAVPGRYNLGTKIRKINLRQFKNIRMIHDDQTTRP